MHTVLERERKKRGWSQREVAKRIGVSAPMMTMIETGKRKPSFDVLIRLLDLFDCSDPRILFREADD